MMDNLMELVRLRDENEAMKADIKLVAVTLKKSLSELGFIGADGNFNFNTRSLGKLLPKVMSGEINQQLTGLADVLPLLDKYKHLADG